MTTNYSKTGVKINKLNFHVNKFKLFIRLYYVDHLCLLLSSLCTILCIKGFTSDQRDWRKNL